MIKGKYIKWSREMLYKEMKGNELIAMMLLVFLILMAVVVGIIMHQTDEKVAEKEKAVADLSEHLCKFSGHKGLAYPSVKYDHAKERYSFVCEDGHIVLVDAIYREES